MLAAYPFPASFDIEAELYGLVGIVVAQRRGAYKPQALIEGDQAKVAGFVVKGVESDAVAVVDHMNCIPCSRARFTTPRSP